MADWGEIAGDHYTALSWSGGLNRDENGYPLSPPCNDVSMSGGIESWMAIATHRRVSGYRCKFCGSMIGFLDRKPRNLLDGSPHRCLAEAANARRNAAPVA